MKKMFSLALALIMALALCVPAMAANGTAAANKGTITINKAEVGQTYTAYQIFELESFSDENPDDTTVGAYSYKVVNAKWKEFVTTGEGKDYIEVKTVGTNDYVEWNADTNDATVAAFAKAALAFAEANGITGTAKTAEAETVTFTEMGLGYYLIDSSLGALCSLNTTDLDAEIQEKNEETTIDKQVKEGSSFGNKNTADIGDTVEFQVTITAKAGAENYVLHDRMSVGLTYGEVTSVTKGGTEVDAAAYTVKTSDICSDCDFEVVFTKEFCESLIDGDLIVVTYTASVNENAVIDNANTNEAKLTYGDENYTEWDETETRTFNFVVNKVTADGTALTGAEFTLSLNADGTDPIKFVAVTGGYRVALADEAGATTSLAAGNINISGLDAATYYLTETKAPDGYNKLAEPVYVQITEDGVVMIENVEHDATNPDSEEYVAASDDVVNVVNNTGTELPSTGGIGTTIFYTVGGLMMAAAVVLFITKKKLVVEE